jgi:hypothetical protein
MSAQLFKGWASHVPMPDQDTTSVEGRTLNGGLHPTDERDLTHEANVLLDTAFEPIEAMWNTYNGVASGVPFHHDGIWPYIAIVSFGCEAEFALRECATGVTMRFTLEHGDLLYVPERINTNWAHAVRSYDGVRWSCVLRPRPSDSRAHTCVIANHLAHDRAADRDYGGHGWSIDHEDRALPHELRVS